MNKILMAGLAGILTVSAAAGYASIGRAQTSQGDDVVSAAAGKTGDHATQLTARMKLCYQAIATGVSPDELTKDMKANGFTDEAQVSTLDTCVVLNTGINIGLEAGYAQAKAEQKTTA